MKHPQTRRMMFLELSFEWAEDMGTSWETFKQLATDDDKDENYSGHAVSTPAQPAHGPAAAGPRSGKTL